MRPYALLEAMEKKSQSQGITLMGREEEPGKFIEYMVDRILIRRVVE